MQCKRLIEGVLITALQTIERGAFDMCNSELRVSKASRLMIDRLGGNAKSVTSEHSLGMRARQCTSIQ